MSYASDALIKATAQRVDAMEKLFAEFKAKVESLNGDEEWRAKVEGEIKAMKMRMGKNNKEI